MAAVVWGIFALVFLLILTVLLFLYLSGMFSGLKVSAKVPGVLADKVVYAYKVHDGPFAEAGYLFTEAYSIYPDCVQCGINYVKEGKSDDASTHSVVGAFVCSTECANLFLKAGFKLTQLPPVTDALCISFPHNSVLSIPIGAGRCYSHLREYLEERHLQANTFLELYDGEYIHFIALLKDSDKFGLPLPEYTLPVVAETSNDQAAENNDVKVPAEPNSGDSEDSDASDTFEMLVPEDSS
ncbi:unnamed protein product [Calicophoron daubneyi]|uniref:Testis-expressed sequence 264 protein n=1 Tax=Calicophoron daubneyi TaxID=300641 RepID=A0AAV2TUP2_CALDB